MKKNRSIILGLTNIVILWLLIVAARSGDIARTICFSAIYLANILLLMGSNGLLDVKNNILNVLISQLDKDDIQAILQRTIREIAYEMQREEANSKKDL